MNTTSSFFFSKSMRALSVTLAMLSGGIAVAQSEMDQSNFKEPVSVYAGIMYGFQVKTGCDGARVCSPARDAVKVFGGYRMTPSLATEVSYYYLGKDERTWDGNGPRHSTVVGTSEVSRRVDNMRTETQALALGVSYESEIFTVATNHLRIGLGYSQTKQKMTLDDGQAVDKEKKRVFPYVGVGISMLVSPTIRLFTGADALFNPDRRHYVFTVGAGGDF